MTRNLGRFLSVDPEGRDPSRPQNWNRYTYAENNPILNIDPSGRYPCLTVGSDGKQHAGECIDVYARVRDAAEQNSSLRDAQLKEQLRRSRGERAGGYTAFYRGFNGYDVWRHLAQYIYHHPEDLATEVAGVFIITDLRYVKGGFRILRGIVTEEGGVEAARAHFERVTGRAPNGSVDQVELPDGTSSVFENRARAAQK